MKTLTRYLLPLIAVLVLVTGVGVSAQLTYSQYAVSSGTVVLDGSNPTSVTTGLKAIRHCNVSLMSPNDSASNFGAAGGGEPVSLTVEFSASRGRLDIYAWDDADPPAASTSTAYFVSYFCVGDV